MTEQGSSGWGLTVSRRFDSESQARQAAESLRGAGFREEEIRVWNQRAAGGSGGEDTLARTVEGLMGGGVVGGLGTFFISVAFNWAQNETVDEEFAAIAALVGAVAGALIAAVGVTVLSRKISFSHPHETHHEAGSVVSVTVGDRESEANQVFDSLG